jgi:ribokinase
MEIVVFGSINMDLVVHAPHLPKPGETLTGTSFHTTPGGKGANQAVACARLGAVTQMIGRVGGDVFGNALIENLTSFGVRTSGIGIEENSPSGVALIEIDDKGENNIIVIPAANGLVGALDLRRLESMLLQAKVLLLQLEIPIKSVREAAEMASAQGVTVILDPAPAQALPEELFGLIDIITPNTTEASVLTGRLVETPSDAHQAAQDLLERGVKNVIIKMGAQGAYLENKVGRWIYPAFPVKAIDTVAAGDAFNGVLAVALSEGFAIEKAMLWGVASGAIAVTKSGAQTAMPTRAEVLELIESAKN